MSWHESHFSLAVSCGIYCDYTYIFRDNVGNIEIAMEFFGSPRSSIWASHSMTIDNLPLLRPVGIFHNPIIYECLRD